MQIYLVLNLAMLSGVIMTTMETWMSCSAGLYLEIDSPKCTEMMEEAFHPLGRTCLEYPRAASHGVIMIRMKTWTLL